MRKWSFLLTCKGLLWRESWWTEPVLKASCLIIPQSLLSLQQNVPAGGNTAWRQHPARQGVSEASLHSRQLSLTQRWKHETPLAQQQARQPKLGGYKAEQKQLVPWISDAGLKHVCVQAAHVFQGQGYTEMLTGVFPAGDVLHLWLESAAAPDPCPAPAAHGRTPSCPRLLARVVGVMTAKWGHQGQRGFVLFLELCWMSFCQICELFIYTPFFF